MNWFVIFISGVCVGIVVFALVMAVDQAAVRLWRGWEATHRKEPPT